MNKADYTRTVTAVHILLLNYQTNYKYNRQPQTNSVINQLIFVKRGKLGVVKVKNILEAKNPKNS